MRARDLFGVIVRTIALLVSLYGFYSIVYAVLEVVQALPGKLSPASHFTFGAVIFLLGVMLLWNAEIVVNLTYLREPPPGFPVVEHDPTEATSNE